MGILSVYTDVTGQINENPRRVKLITTDNLATITTAGYLHNVNLQGYTIYDTDIIDCWYGWVSATNPGTYAIFTVTISNGVITMVEWANPGDVLLPVVSNDFANFNGTTGQIKDAGYSPSDPAKTKVVMANAVTVANHIMVSTDTAGTVGNKTGTAINDGSLQAGRSTIAGSLISYPSAATSGSLSVTSIANAGDYANVISNASTGQATTWSLPDPGAATANILISTSSSPQTMTGGLTISTGDLNVSQGNVIAGSSGHAGTLSSFPATAANGELQIIAVNNASNFKSIISNSAVGQETTYTLPDPTVAGGNVAVSAAGALVSGNVVQASGVDGLITDAGFSASGLQILSAAITLSQADVQGMYAAPIQIVAAQASKVIVPVQATIYTNFQTSAFADGGVAILQYDSTVHGAGTNALAATIPAAEITAASSQIYNLAGATATVLTAITNKGLYFSNQTGAFTAGDAASTVVVVVSYYLVTATV